MRSLSASSRCCSTPSPLYHRFVCVGESESQLKLLLLMPHAREQRGRPVSSTPAFCVFAAKLNDAALTTTLYHDDATPLAFVPPVSVPPDHPKVSRHVRDLHLLRCACVHLRGGPQQEVRNVRDVSNPRVQHCHAKASPTPMIIWMIRRLLVLRSTTVHLLLHVHLVKSTTWPLPRNSLMSSFALTTYRLGAG